MRQLIALSFLLAAAACGGGSSVSPPPGPPPPPPPPPAPAPVASVTVTSPATSVLAGGTVQLSATPKDAAGNALNSRVITWAATPGALATISGAGLLTTITPGDVTVTATSEGINGSATVTVVDPTNIPFFDKPFAGEFPVGNFLDHNIPKEFVDNNGIFVTYWGEVHGVTDLTDGHSGYDFNMPVGTPLLAVAPGKVVRILTSTPPFFCPSLGHDVSDQMSIYIEHQLPGGIVIQSNYVHLSRIDVTLNQVVTAGQQVALSGNTGCSTAPHLHFEVYKASTVLTTIDPYGWTGTGPDPWSAALDGAQSIQLWKAGKAPVLAREITFDLNGNAAFAPVVLTRIVYEGVNDAANPNNEFIELTLDTRMAATLSLAGYGFIPMGQPSLTYAFPAGVTLTAANPTVRVYTGSGTNAGLTLYMGHPSGIWVNNFNQLCAIVTYPGGAAPSSYFNCAF